MELEWNHHTSAERSRGEKPWQWECLVTPRLQPLAGGEGMHPRGRPSGLAAARLAAAPVEPVVAAHPLLARHVGANAQLSLLNLAAAHVAG